MRAKSTVLDTNAQDFFQHLHEATEYQSETLLKSLPSEIHNKDSVYGFPVEENIPNPRKVKLDSWINGKHHFYSDIQDGLGIKPVAIIHMDTWSKLCRELGLFRLGINNLGGVNADVGELNDVVNAADMNYGIISGALGGVAIGVFLSLFIVFASFDKFSAHPLGSVLFFIALCTFLAIMCALLSFIDALGSRKEARVKLSKKHGRLHILFPNMTHFSGNRDRSAKSIAVSFVKPPEELVPLLRKIRRGNEFFVEVVADPDAISADSNKEVPDWMAYGDPVITLVRGEHVAVIAQFGKFPLEEEATGNVLNNITELV